MNRIKQGSVVIGTVLLLAAFFQLAIAVTTPQRKVASSARRTKQVSELFKRNCARCHGSNGRGQTPLGQMFKSPDFTDGDWWSQEQRLTGTKSQTIIVMRGKGSMPAFGKKLSRSEIVSLVNYVRRFQPKK